MQFFIVSSDKTYFCKPSRKLSKYWKIAENQRFYQTTFDLLTSLEMHEFSITKCKSYAQAIMPVAAVLRPIDGMS